MILIARGGLLLIRLSPPFNPSNSLPCTRWMRNLLLFFYSHFPCFFFFFFPHFCVSHWTPGFPRRLNNLRPLLIACRRKGCHLLSKREKQLLSPFPHPGDCHCPPLPKRTDLPVSLLMLRYLRPLPHRHPSWIKPTSLPATHFSLSKRQADTGTL